MHIAYFCRKPAEAQISLERVFKSVRNAMPELVKCSAFQCKHNGTSPSTIMLNILDAHNHQGDVNHITGDIHYLALGLDGRRTILTIHDCRSLIRLTGLKRRLFQLLWYDQPMKRCRIITTISRFTANELIEFAPWIKNRVRVIYNPIGDAFQPAPKEFNTDRPVILQVGTGHNKNLIRVAQALKGIRCHLEIVGRLSTAQKETLCVNGINYSSSHGLSDDDIVNKYRHSDIVVFTSTYEGFGMPIIEAQATGRPVVTSNICSMPEVAGSGACLVDPYDVLSIRNGIMRMTNDRTYRDEMIDHGYENVKRFAATKIALEYAELYQAILCCIS
ncbi:MAG: glycosyltransferase family 1 protein [Armatimonadota bacterium]